MVEIDFNKQNIKLKGEFFPNLSEWSYICNNSSTEDLEPLTTLIAPVAIIPKWKTKHENENYYSLMKYINKQKYKIKYHV